MVNLNTYKQKKKELGLTFDQLSKMSGVPLQTLHNIFRGHTQNPRIDTMQAIEEALGLSTPPLQWTEEDKALGVGLKPKTSHVQSFIYKACSTYTTITPQKISSVVIT